MLHSTIMKCGEKRGFTMVELVVVLAVISIISSVVLNAFSEMQSKARDAKRLSDMREIVKALTLYAETSNPDYPVANPAVTITGSSTFSTTLEGAGVISAVPKDPLHPTFTYTYLSSTGSEYTLSFCLEGSNIENFSEGCGNTISP